MIDSQLFTNADFYLSLIQVAESCTFFATSFILYRFLAITIATAYGLVCLWVGLSSPGMTSILAGASVDVAVNLFMVASFYYAQSIHSLPKGWRKIYGQHFKVLRPYEFKRLVKLADLRVIDNDAGMQTEIAVAGDVFRNLFFIVEGGADVLVESNRCSVLEEGDWICEISMLTDKPLSADVRVEKARLLAWDRKSLETFKAYSAEAFEKINALIARNLCDKLVRSNQQFRTRAQ